MPQNFTILAGASPSAVIAMREAQKQSAGEGIALSGVNLSGVFKAKGIEHERRISWNFSTNSKCQRKESTSIP
jgi:hypothetical protein